MTQDEIIQLARQVGAKTPRLIWPPTFTKSIDFTPEALEIFAKLIAAKEREACAKLVGEFAQNYSAYELSTIIRARGQA